MIPNTKKRLRFFIQADRMINFGKFHNSLFDRLKLWIGLNKIGSFLVTLRKYEYYLNQESGIKVKILRQFYRYKWVKQGQKLGFTIYPNVVDYALSLDHWGTIVIGNENRIGAYALIHTSTCIPMGNRVIGDFLRLSAGAKITGKGIKLGNGISVAANSVVTKDCISDNKLLAGMPAKPIKDVIPWVILDGEVFKERFRKIEVLKEKMGLGENLYEITIKNILSSS